MHSIYCPLYAVINLPFLEVKPTNMCGLFYKNYMGRIYNNNNNSIQLFFIEET